MSDTYLYKFENNLYINLTNRCPCNCSFCLRNNGDGIGGHKLWLKAEPSAQAVIDGLSGFDNFNEAVFCGYGESTYRLNEIIEIAKYLKSKGYKTRLDTNGLGSLINGFDITDMLCKVIDTVSVSLNQSSAEKYNEICKPIYENAYEAMLDFTKKCVEKGIRATMTVVDVIPKEDIEKCNNIAKSLGAVFRVREYIK